MAKNDRMEPKLNRSIPKDQIGMLLGSMVAGVVIGLSATYFALGFKGITVFAAGYAIFGALEGAFDLTHKYKPLAWIPIVAITALLPLGFEHSAVGREAFAGGVSCIVAGGLMAAYHFVRSAQDA